MIRFVNPATGEEGKVDGDDCFLYGDPRGGVVEIRLSTGCWWHRPDLRAEFVPDWIGVEERLPEESFTQCLLRIEGALRGTPLVWIEQGMWSAGAGSWMMTNQHDEPFAITHWMPLPSTEVGK